MTPAEKAKELIDKYIALTDGWVVGQQNLIICLVALLPVVYSMCP